MLAPYASAVCRHIHSLKTIDVHLKNLDIMHFKVITKSSFSSGEYSSKSVIFRHTVSSIKCSVAVVQRSNIKCARVLSFSYLQVAFFILFYFSADIGWQSTCIYLAKCCCEKRLGFRDLLGYSMTRSNSMIFTHKINTLFQGKIKANLISQPKTDTQLKW